MASSLSSKKRIRQNIKARSRNRWRMRTLRDSLKAFDDRVMHGTVDEAQDALKAALQLLDKTASVGVIHKNNAARRKSRLTKRFLAKKAG